MCVYTCVEHFIVHLLCTVYFIVFPPFTLAGLAGGMDAVGVSNDSTKSMIKKYMQAFL